MPTWNAPTYSPSSNVTITPGVKTVTVGNSWGCTGGQTGGNAIVHLVKGLQGPPAIPGAPPPPAITVPFTFTSNCSAPSTPTSLTFNGGGGGIFTVPLGSTCNIMEAMPPLPAAAMNYCAPFGGQIAMWDTPTWSIPQPMTVNQNGMIVAVTNKWICAPPPPSIIIPGEDAADQPEKKKKKKLKLPKIRINVGIPIPGGNGDGGKKEGGDGDRSDDAPPKP